MTVRCEHSGGRNRPKPAGRVKGLGVETGCEALADENQFQEVGCDVARQLAGQRFQPQQGRAATMRETIMT